MIYVKIHKGGNSFVTSICDSELVGKKFLEGKLVLDVSERFFKGELVSEEEVCDYFKDAVNLNIVGKRSCGIALKMGLISSENILVVGGVKHAQCVIL